MLMFLQQGSNTQGLAAIFHPQTSRSMLVVLRVYSDIRSILILGLTMLIMTDHELLDCALAALYPIHTMNVRGLLFAKPRT